jgi:hypothetical protein
VTPFNRASDVLTGCDSGTAVDVCSSGFEQSAARSLVYNQVLRCVLLCAGPSSCNWKKMVEAMVERRSDCVLVSLLHRYCQNQQQHQNQLQYQNQQQLGMITLYTLSSFFIEAPKRLFRNFIEEGGVALLSAAVKALSADIASPYNTISAAAVFKIVWSLTVNVTCTPVFDTISSTETGLQKDAKESGSPGITDHFSIVDGFSDDEGDNLTKLRFVNQELLPVSPSFSPHFVHDLDYLS